MGAKRIVFRMEGDDMTRAALLTLGLLVTGFASVQPSYTAAAQGAGGFTTLFDGKSLKGWDVVGDANWSVANGEIQANKGSGFLVTPVSYPDFQMTLDFWVTDDANSGVFIRCSDPKKITAANAYEVNIFDKRPDQSYRTGGIVDVAKPSRVINTGGKWNSYDIMAKGPKMTITLNGVKVVDVEDTKHAGGPIALQYGGGTVKFRNVRIRKL
jgi:3-keto-disaccharide hydrolase